MNIQVSSKLAKIGSRLAAIGGRHRELEDRIAKVEKLPQPDPIVLQRRKREKLRIKDEMRYCEGMLRTLTRRLHTRNG